MRLRKWCNIIRRESKLITHRLAVPTPQKIILLYVPEESKERKMERERERERREKGSTLTVHVAA